MRLLALIALFLLAAGTAPATTFVVDDAGAAHDASPGDGTCATAGATCTLVAAMDEANAHPDVDVIQLPPGTYTYTATLPTVVSTMTIEPTTGTDPSATVIHSSDTGHPRLFDVEAGGDLTLDTLTLENAQTGPGSAVEMNDGNATLTNCVVTNNTQTALYAANSGSNTGTLTLTGTKISSNTSVGNAGALEVSFANLVATNSMFSSNMGPLGAAYLHGSALYTQTFTGCTFTGNSATGNGGGALYITAPVVTIDASTFTNNTNSYPSYAAGAILGFGTAPGTVITNTTFSGNQTTYAGAGGANGGAIFVLNRVSCTGCTFSGNSATGNGGAIFAGANDGAEFDAVNCTFSGNSAAGGGAIAGDGSGVIELSSVTITDNTATGAHASGGGGGGINTVIMHPRNTIIAGNHAPLGGPDCDGNFTSQGYDLLGDDTDCLVMSATGDLIGTGGSPIDPGLDVLFNNGGPTLTHALLASSPAGEAGNPTGCKDQNGTTLTTDQRGHPRTVDGDSDGTARCDIGAYEAPEGTFPTPTTTTVATTTTATTSTSTTSTVTTTTATTTTAAPMLPPGGCDAEPVAATFASIDCRLAALLARVNETPALGQFAGRLAQNLGKAKSDTEAGQTSCASSDVKHARQRLKQAIRGTIQYHHQLVTTAARKKIDPAVRQDFADKSTPIQADLKTLRTNVHCPSDA